MTWQDLFTEEMKKEYFQNLNEKVNHLYETKTIFPPKEDLYKAFLLTPLDQVKVVIIGQDPYQTRGFANGLAFSVNDGIKIPKSLQNIFKEYESDLGFKIPSSGNLCKWATSGILLLNRILTVEEGKPLSHKGIGWEEFTKAAILKIEKCNKKIVYILLGNEAKKIKEFIANPNHLIIEEPHPSPLSAYHGFFGCKLFIRTIEFLNETKELWRLE